MVKYVAGENSDVVVDAGDKYVAGENWLLAQ